ncbi:MAG: hypothetical protein PVI30_09930 [Myxococcales bacterium]|jgi:hypothetical protein
MRAVTPLLPPWLVLTLVGCAAPLPALSLKARLSLRDGGRSQQATIGTAASWRARRPPTPEHRAAARVAPAAAPRRPCQGSPLCAWQRRAIRRALLSLDQEELPWTD